MNSTKSCLAELKRLVKVAKANLYRRVELVATVLADMDWIAREHGGSELQAHDSLQSEFFPDLGGYLSLGKLVQMFRSVEKAQWASYGYDVAAVEVIYDEQRRTTTKEEKGARTSWKTLAVERAERIVQLEATIVRLTATNDQLHAENAELRIRIATLEGAISERRASAARAR